MIDAMEVAMQDMRCQVSAREMDGNRTLRQRTKALMSMFWRLKSDEKTDRTEGEYNEPKTRKRKE